MGATGEVRRTSATFQPQEAQNGTTNCGKLEAAATREPIGDQSRPAADREEMAHDTGSSNRQLKNSESSKVKANSAQVDKKLNKKAKSSKKGRKKGEDAIAGCNKMSDPAEGKPKTSLVEELKLFQNNKHLLNQEDPIQQLHAQLNELIKSQDDSIGKKKKRDISSKASQPPNRSSATPCMPTQNGNSYSHEQQSDGRNNSQQQFNNYNSDQNQLTSEQLNDSCLPTTIPSNADQQRQDRIEGDSMFTTLKKGVLWQQQNFEKFHQRLFSSRWKKRYFILTTDYLVCFKRSSSKVGHSEMGKFLYKTSLNDVMKIEWSKPRKSDKGAIVLHLDGQFNLMLWSKNYLDEWMFMINESMLRNKMRKSYINRSNINEACNKDLSPSLSINGAAAAAAQMSINHAEGNNDLYENFISNKVRPGDNHSITKPTERPGPGKPTERGQDRKLTMTISQAHETSQQLSATRALRESNEQQVRAGDSPSAEIKLHQRDDDELKSIEHEDFRGKTENGSNQPQRTDNDQGSSQTGGRAAERESVNVHASDTKTGEATTASGDASPKSLEPAKANKPSRADGNDLSTENLPGTANSKSSGSSHSGQRQDRSEKSSLAKRSEPNSIAGSVSSRAHQKIEAQNSNSGAIPRDREENECNIETSDTGASPKTKMISDKRAREQQQRSSFRAPASNGAGGNLIRRDDSWQSLVSLTRVGKATPTEMQVVQRSLYAQHIMPNSSAGIGSKLAGGHRQQSLAIESTITPSRAPFLYHQKQQLIQSSDGQRKLRALPVPIGLIPQAVSLDIGASNSPRSGSTQQKLLQLQLLHNSNNVDYIRHNGDPNDYQIYGPEYSQATSHYGYSSMRSNLKSATSEFSFIRPSPSAHNQSTLPHNHHNQQQRRQMALDNQGTHHLPTRTSLILQPGAGARIALPFAPQPENDINNNIINNNNERLSKQFLVNPLTGERLVNEPGGLLNHQQQQLAMPPTRELPLKPNKRRAAQEATCNQQLGGNGNNLPKSSSLTSSIACFFRRAFSRRSRKNSARRHNSKKMTESCSSSLGAFEDGFVGVPMVPSAFSTGSKSVDGRQARGDQQQQQQVTMQQNQAQSQRMVDMIEAFAGKALVGAELTPAAFMGKEKPLDMARIASPKVHTRSGLNQFGSPLHKSNSVSAMGLNLADNRSRSHADQLIALASGVGIPSGSPIMTRSSKVMSANLTPLMSQREPVEVLANQFFLSPRNSRSDQAPRPSSIYGQPSMISSPVINHRPEDRSFGPHRSSLHSHSQNQFRDRSSNNFELRRNHHQMKMPFLDTTREVAEEITSPTTETIVQREFHDSFAGHQEELAQNQRRARQADVEQSPHGMRYSMKQRDNFDGMISASPSSGALRQQQQLINRQAIVNPILQSPTMNTIYDNHPMLNGLQDSNHSSSHYDNHNQLMMMDQHRHSPSLFGLAQFHGDSQNSPINRGLADNLNRFEYSRKLKHSHSTSNTPLHGGQSSRPVSDATTSAKGLMAAAHSKKPSAIVAPSTPNHNSLLHRNQPSTSDEFTNSIGSPIVDSNARNYNQQQPSRSPMMARRAASQQSHYQQSPLVSQQTRVLNKGDGVQATVFGDSRNRLVGQAVINIAGAPGINLEPSLAASLLRGTNIDAYESSTFDRSLSSASNSERKTFLVSTRMSQSIAYGHSSPKSIGKDQIDSSAGSTTPANSSAANRNSPRGEELSMSGSRSINSSIGQGSMKTRCSRRLGTGSSQDDNLEESSGSETAKGERELEKVVKHIKQQPAKIPSIRDSSRRNRKESGSEPSDGIDSRTESLDNDSEERNWIVSKLVN